MSTKNGCPSPTLKAGTEIKGFTVEQVEPIRELQATAYLLRHGVTGAKVLHLHCADRENLYSITFRTPPSDSTGVAHILEHSVLAGSKNYPVKDAFNELSKSTLNTFINAFTAPDFTCYPACSEVRADFYNLASVYTDLVLRPLLKENTFRREGHHLQLSEEGELKLSGIVFNEMKGAFSTLERAAQSRTIQALFPDTPYGVESGGRPECIPELSFQDFCNFHRQFYSPSNARFFLYGDLPTTDHIDFLSDQLAGFEAVEVTSEVPLQSRWSEPVSVSDEYPIGPDDPVENRSIVNLAWLTAPAADLEERLVLEVLQEALVGNSAAPLRKALIDSKLGQDLSPTTGLMTWYKELPFVVGLRGTDPDKRDQIVALTEQTLLQIADHGISTELLEAAIHQVEFSGLEISRSPMPFSLNLLFRSLSTWLHDNDPLLPLTFPTLMASLRKRWENDPNLFQNAVRKWLVDNRHRVTATITPSRTLAQEQVAAEKEKLALQKKQMSEDELAEIRAIVDGLNAEQQKKDTAEELACLPQLSLEQIPTEVDTLPINENSIGEVQVLEHELFANGIAYLDVAFDISDIPEELQIYLPLLGAAATGMGAAGLDYEAFATRKALATGAVTARVDAASCIDDGHMQYFFLSSRALERNIPVMAELVRDILVAGELDDTERLKDLVSQARNQLRASIAPQGHLFSMRSSAAGLSLPSWRDEQWHGATQLNFLNQIADQFESRIGELRENMSRLRELVFRRDRMLINLTADGGNFPTLRKATSDLIDAIPAGGAATDATVPQLRTINPAVAIPGNVCYVARSLQVPGITEPGAAELWVLSNYLRTGYLYKKIRVEGGAYGGMCVYSPLERRLSMLSYRDPNLEKTLAVYDGSLQSFLSEELSDDDLRKAIVGSVGRLDRVLDPRDKGYESMRRHLTGLSDPIRQKLREGILSTTTENLRRCVTEIATPAMATAKQAAYAPKERLDAANAELAEPFTITGNI
jgi:presequence protease